MTASNPLPDDLAAARNSDGDNSADYVSLVVLFQRLRSRWLLLASGTLLGGALGFGIASLMPDVFTARTTLIPPQQQGSASAALAQLGALAALAGGGGVKTTTDQYVALLRSTTVSDRIIDEFKLLEVYGVPLRHDARKRLSDNARFSVGKKDGLLIVEVDDRDPERAAKMANAFVSQLRALTNVLAVTEAQQRRLFFERQLVTAQSNLTRAQSALESSGFSSGALKVEPRAFAEGYARLRAEVMAAEIRVQGLQRLMTDDSPELMQQRAILDRLRAELSRAERRGGERDGNADYVNRLREFKYQETLFEMFARQYELARVDESREGGLIQVVDLAIPPERRSSPRRGLISLTAALAAFLAFCALILVSRPRERYN